MSARKQDNIGQSNSLMAPSEGTPLLLPGPATAGHRTNDAVATMANTDGALIARPSTDDTDSTAEPIFNKHMVAKHSPKPFRGTCTIVAIGWLIFIQATNMSLVTTTSSNITKGLNAYENSSWLTSVYMIVWGALSPLNGKLALIFSTRKCIFAASIFLAMGALICGGANDFATFVVGRAICGVGASGVYTISMIIAVELVGPKWKGIAMGTLNSGLTIGVAIGATIAGALVDIVGWRALFWMQTPITLSAGIVLLLTIPSNLSAGKDDSLDSVPNTWQSLRRIDYLGAICLTGSLVLLLYALSSPTKIPILPIILSLVVGALFVLVEIWIAHDPIVPVALLKHRGLLLSCFGTLGFMMCRWTVLFNTPTLAIAVRQYSPSVGGSLLLPTNVGFAAGGLLVGWLHIKRDGSFYMPTLMTYAVLPMTLFLLAMMARRESSITVVIAILFVCGFTTGAALNYNFAHILHLTPKETHYIAAALMASFRGFAGSFGSAIGGGLFTRTLSTSLAKHFAERNMERSSLIRQLLGLPDLVRHLSGAEQEVAVMSYEEALRTLWLAAALLAVVAVVVQAGTGFKGHEEKQKELEERAGLRTP